MRRCSPLPHPHSLPDPSCSRIWIRFRSGQDILNRKLIDFRDQCHVANVRRCRRFWSSKPNGAILGQSHIWGHHSRESLATRFPEGLTYCLLIRVQYVDRDRRRAFPGLQLCYPSPCTITASHVQQCQHPFADFCSFMQHFSLSQSTASFYVGVALTRMISCSI